MRRSTALILLGCLSAIAAPAIFPQTRPRRVETQTAAPPAAVPLLNKPSEPASKAVGQPTTDPPQTNKVLTEFWGNPPDDKPTLGMLCPADTGLVGPDSWGVIVTYEEDGYV